MRPRAASARSRDGGRVPTRRASWGPPEGRARCGARRRGPTAARPPARAPGSHRGSRPASSPAEDSPVYLEEPVEHAVPAVMGGSIGAAPGAERREIALEHGDRGFGQSRPIARGEVTAAAGALDRFGDTAAIGG